MSCTSDRSLSRGFNIFWAVQLYCLLFKKDLNEVCCFIEQFSTKALHMAYAAMMDSVIVHHGCFCTYCKVKDHCRAVLIERGKFPGPDGYYPCSIESIDKWAPDEKQPLPYFHLYFNYTT